MKQFETFFKFGFLRSKYMLVVSLGLGIMLCGLLYTFSKADFAYSGMKLYIIDEDQSQLSNALCEYLKDEIGTENTYGTSYDEGSYGVIEREYSAVLEIPQGYEQKCIAKGSIDELTITTVDDYANQAFLEAYVSAYLQAAQTALATCKGDSEQFHLLLDDLKEEVVSIREVSVDATLEQEQAQAKGLELAVGFFLNFGFIYGIIIALMIYEDRKEGIFRRVRVTPANSLQYILGIMSYMGLLGIGSVAILLLFIQVTGWNLGVSFAGVAYCLLMYIPVVLATSIAIALVVKSKIAMIFIIYGSGCLAAMLGGAYFETDKASEGIQILSKLVPQHWIMDYIRNGAAQGDGVPNQMIILGLYVVFLVLIAAIVYNKQVGNNVE